MTEKKKSTEIRLQFINTVKKMSETIESNPNDVYLYHSYYIRGHAYLMLKQFEKSIEDLNRSMELNTGKDEFYYNAIGLRGLDHFFVKEFERGIADYTESIANEPFFRTINNRGLCYAVMGEYEKAKIDCERALEITPVYDYGFICKGVIATGLKDYNQALIEFMKAINIDPENPLIYRFRGDLYAKVGEFKLAKEDYMFALNLDEEHVLTKESLEELKVKIEDPDLEERFSFCSSRYDHVEIFLNGKSVLIMKLFLL